MLVRRLLFPLADLNRFKCLFFTSIDIHIKHRERNCGQTPAVWLINTAVPEGASLVCDLVHFSNTLRHPPPSHPPHLLARRRRLALP